jgi:hypothetical protein
MAAVAALAAGAALISAAAVTAIAVVVNATRWLLGLERLSMQNAFPKGTPTWSALRRWAWAGTT